MELSDFQIQNFGGVDELDNFLNLMVKMPGFHAVKMLGVVRDAETSAEGAFQSVQSSLRNAGLPVPERPGERAGAAPAVNVLILPGEQSSGMLETLLCRTFANTAVDRCIDDFFKCFEEAGYVFRIRTRPARVPFSRLGRVHRYPWGWRQRKAIGGISTTTYSVGFASSCHPWRRTATGWRIRADPARRAPGQGRRAGWPGAVTRRGSHRSGRARFRDPTPRAAASLQSGGLPTLQRLARSTLKPDFDTCRY